MLAIWIVALVEARLDVRPQLAQQLLHAVTQLVENEKRISCHRDLPAHTSHGTTLMTT